MLPLIGIFFIYCYLLFIVPSSIQTIQDQTVTVMSSVTFPCQVSGIPTPMVSWIKPDGQRVDTDVLELMSINRNEAGEYRCEASNECGNASQAASIDVQCKCVFLANIIFLSFMCGTQVHIFSMKCKIKT